MSKSLEKLYDKVISKIKIIDKTDPNEWTIKDAMVYIAYKYKEKFGQDFIFTYDNVPSRCIEYKMTSRVWMMLGKAGDGKIIKDYIDWFYDNYRSKRKFVSINALAKPKLVYEYKDFKDKPITINTTKELDNKIQNILQQYEETSYIVTYGDLYFFVESLKNNNDFKFDLVKNDMIKAGFDFEILNKVI